MSTIAQGEPNCSSVIAPHSDPVSRWSRLPAEMRSRPQWVLAAPDDKRPRKADGGLASSTAPGTWTSFTAACTAAVERGWDISFVTTKDDPFSCIDLDVRDDTSAEQLERHDAIVSRMASYTERSRSGRGRHVWVRAEVGRGCRRDGVELYSQERHIICTGDVLYDVPIAERQDIISAMAAQMRPAVSPDTTLRPDEPGDEQGWYIAQVALDDPGEMGLLMRGDWERTDEAGKPRYPSQSEADLALLRMMGRLTEANGPIREAFRLSGLGRRDKAKREDYLDRTLRAVRAALAEEAHHVAEGARIEEGLFFPIALAPAMPNPLQALRVDWETDEDAEVPDIIAGLIADEEVTLLGGHGGIGKSFLALQMACAVATGEAVLHRPVRQCRVLYYSAEDGRKRLTRRLRELVAAAGLDRAALAENLMLLDASEVEPLYGETVEHGDGKRPAFAKLLGPCADFTNLQAAVQAFDPQLVVVDGASDTFDGNEIARRDVRAFIKLLRRVHPTRKVGVLLLAHIDRASARGHVSNDDGYAGSGQWHNSCRRRLFLQQEVKREKDEFTDGYVMTLGAIKLRVMKNQDGPPEADTVLSRGANGLWQVGAADISALLPTADQPDHGPTLLRLIASYHERGTSISTSLAPQAPSGVYATLKGDPLFPTGLSQKRTAAVVRQLERDGLLVKQQYKRVNRSTAERWIAFTGPDLG